MAYLGDKAKVGEFYKVKATPTLRKYGVNVGGRWAAAADSKAWPGDVGEVVERRWTWECSLCTRCGPRPDCSQCAGRGSGESSDLVLVFSRGRQLTLSTADADDFIRIRKPPVCPV